MRSSSVAWGSSNREYNPGMSLFSLALAASTSSTVQRVYSFTNSIASSANRSFCLSETSSLIRAEYPSSFTSVISSSNSPSRFRLLVRSSAYFEPGTGCSW